MDRNGQREIKILRWGLIPSWAKDPKIGSRMINARLESASEKPSFRAAWKKRRAIIPADGYYEWYTSDAVSADGKKPPKQPYYIHRSDDHLLGMAGLYEIWRNPAVADEDDPDAFRWTCTILTTNATDALGKIHDRMPLIVSGPDIQDWLDPTNTDPSLQLLTPAAQIDLDAYPISTLVNKVSNNSAALLEPLAAQ